MNIPTLRKSPRARPEQSRREQKVLGGAALERCDYASQLPLVPTTPSHPLSFRTALAVRNLLFIRPGEIIEAAPPFAIFRRVGLISHGTINFPTQAKIRLEWATRPGNGSTISVCRVNFCFASLATKVPNPKAYRKNRPSPPHYVEQIWL